MNSSPLPGTRTRGRAALLLAQPSYLDRTVNELGIAIGDAPGVAG